MAIDAPRKQLVSLAAAGTTPRAASYEPHPSATRVTLFALFDTAGTLAISRVAADGSQAALGASVSVSANTLSVTNFDYNTGPISITYTPGTGPTTGYVEAQYAGHGSVS